MYSNGFMVMDHGFTERIFWKIQVDLGGYCLGKYRSNMSDIVAISFLYNRLEQPYLLGGLKN